MFVLAAATTSAPARAATEELSHLGSASCSPDGVRHSEITHVCHQGDRIRAVFRYSSQPLNYEICLRFARGPTSCGPKRRSEPGESSIAFVSSENFIGLVTVTWRVHSEVVGSWKIRFVKDPIVPPFGINPLIVSGTHRLFGLLIRHISAGLRVRAWQQCGTANCPLRLRLVSNRGETRRYRVSRTRHSSTFSFGDELYVQVDAPGKRYGSSKLWGRLYRGELVRDRSGGPNATAIRRVGPVTCTPPGSAFAHATECGNVPGSKIGSGR